MRRGICSTFRSGCAAFLIASMAAGCATLPSAELTDGFGKRTATAAALFKQGIEFQVSTGIQTASDAQASILLDNRFQPDGEIYSFDIKPDVDLSATKEIRARVGALGALEEYGKALASASDQATVEKLEAAAARLGASAAAYIAVQAPGTATIAGPVGKVVSRIGGWAISSNYARKVQKIVASQDATVARLVQLLKKDVPKVADHLRIEATKYGHQRKIIVDQVGLDREVDQLKLYYEYRTARQEVATMKAMAGMLDNYGRVLDAMAKAHHAIATEDPDSSLYLQRFIALTEDLTALTKVLAQ